MNKNLTPIVFLTLIAALVLSACGILPERVSVPPAQAIQACSVGDPEAVIIDGRRYNCADVESAIATLGAPLPAATAPASATPMTVAPAAAPTTIASSGTGYGPCDVGGLSTFVPADNETYGRYATDVVMPDGLALKSAYRSWQAVNPDRRGSKNTIWINLVADLQSTDPASVTLTLKEPIRYEIRGKGIFVLVLTRDLHAVEQLKERNQFSGIDPYDVAVTGDYSQQSKTLSVYWQGSARIYNQACTWFDLNRTSFSQAPFEKNFKDGYVFYLDLGQGGAVDIWLGSSEFVSGTTLHSAFDLPIITAR